MLFRSGDSAPDGPAVRYQALNPAIALPADRAGLRSYLVFGDADSFRDYYGEAEPVSPKFRSVDFGTNYLVAIHQGLCPTGGYSIRVASVRARQDVVTVTVEFQEPGPDDIVTMAMTTPRLFLLIPRRRGTVSPLFRFRSLGGAILAERRPMYGKAAPNEAKLPQS